MFSYLSPEQRVREDHPLRAVRAQVDEVLGKLSPLFDAMYSRTGRPPIPPENVRSGARQSLIFALYFGLSIDPCGRFHEGSASGCHR